MGAITISKSSKEETSSLYAEWESMSAMILILPGIFCTFRLKICNSSAYFESRPVGDLALKALSNIGNRMQQLLYLPRRSTNFFRAETTFRASISLDE
ncbi:hypothetical protein CEXT_219911 [Caerostris extrusa]|uniref:Uncharacterized protein n=1 Tax=Caerostris extrusa TaxID=172846 RepID=A0AAV4NXM9_CAEEX|nr:hypothetical protein CEXT_219911 [Caerostris extrusa]